VSAPAGSTRALVLFLLLTMAHTWPLASAPHRLSLNHNSDAQLNALLRDEPGDVLLAEMPFYPPDAVVENGEYVLNATGHWRPVMNGYSGVTPMSYRRHAETLWYFPQARAFPTLQAAGATHVMVHLEKFGAEAADVVRSLDGRPDLRLIAADRDGHRLYRLVRE